MFNILSNYKFFSNMCHIYKDTEMLESLTNLSSPFITFLKKIYQGHPYSNPCLLVLSL